MLWKSYFDDLPLDVILPLSREDETFLIREHLRWLEMKKADTKAWACDYIGPGGVRYGILCYGPTEEAVREKHAWLKSLRIHGVLQSTSFIW